MRKRIIGISALLPLLFAAFTPLTLATPLGDNIVINEVYTYGASKNNQYLDYVELYNPTEKAVSLDGWSIQYFAKTATKASNVIKLKGTIAAKSHYLVTSQSSQGQAGFTPLPADVSGDLALAKNDGAIVLFNISERQVLTTPVNTADLGHAVDAFGWGSAQIRETQSNTAKPDADKSFNRAANGADTDNNREDFTLAAPSPMNSGAATETGDENTPANPSVPEASDGSANPVEVSISEIQGTGNASPLVGQNVKTKGVVTAAYPSGGFNGIYIQSAGAPTAIPEASTGIFVYSSKIAKAVKIGDYLELTGEVAEYVPDRKGNPNQSITQIKPEKWEKLADRLSVEPLELRHLPAGDIAREKLEGMLVKITGEYTVTNNYNTNRYGQVGLAAGSQPLRQPSDEVNPTLNRIAAEKIEAENAEKLITLDDGISRDLTKETSIPAAYLDVNNPIRVGAQVIFKQPMIVEHRFQWNLQPISPATAAAENDQASWNNSFQYIELKNNQRPDAPADLGGLRSIASFNVLNYFTDLGIDEDGCGAYHDRDGEPVTAKNCDVRGAYSVDAFERQQGKIVQAINSLDASVLGLEEIENSAKFGQDRDASLKTLTAALNKAAGFEKWAIVPSPDHSIPSNEDVIRLAFIYQPELVELVGDSQILDAEVFDGVARQPLAQRFRAKNITAPRQDFTVIVNHFKSKGSVSKKFPNDTDHFQGSNNKLRTAQARALTSWVSQEFNDEAVFLIGDFNSYSREDPILAIEEAGFVNLADHFAPLAPSYQYDGLVGSLDHALANTKALELVTGAQVWSVNAMEPLAFEYSRYNYNVSFQDLFDTTAFRSSDHDPVKVGLFAGTGGAQKQAPGDARNGEADALLVNTGGSIAGILFITVALLLLGVGIMSDRNVRMFT